MTDRDLCIESSKGTCSRGCSVTMNENNVRMTLFEHITESGEDSSCYIGKILTLLHDVEIIIRCHIKDFENLIKHFAMLTGYTNDRRRTDRLRENREKRGGRQ